MVLSWNTVPASSRLWPLQAVNIFDTVSFNIVTYTVQKMLISMLLLTDGLLQHEYIVFSPIQPNTQQQVSSSVLY